MLKSYHGGEFFNAIGNDFSTLEKSSEVINADVLDAWFDPSPNVIAKIQQYLPFILRTSPPNYSEGLIRTLSLLRQIPEKNIIAGEGSSELIYLFFQHFVSPSDTALIPDPTYGEYQHVLQNICHAKLVRHYLQKENEFEIHTEKIINDIRTAKPSFVIIVNPNSPTGKYLPKEKLLSLLRSSPKETFFIIDETYIDYTGGENSLEQEVMRFENLAIIKSMSKVYALSGARVGYLVASERIIERLSLYLPPWSISLFGQIAAIEALKDGPYYRMMYDNTSRLRADVLSQLRTFPSIKVYDSAANFYLLELLYEDTAREICEALARQNIYVRNPDSMSTQFNNKFIRIAVKNKPSNDTIISALKNVLSCL